MRPLLGPEFDTFLFAPIDEEAMGAPLSVVSALARLDVDPWQEAAALARMPREAANQRLTALIATLPETRLAPAAIAKRLIKLLPRGDSAPVALPEKSPRSDPMPAPRTSRNLILINLLVVVGLLVAQWAVASLWAPHPGTVPAVESGTAIPPKPPAHKIN